ncbi:MAG TPA: hypothetical protein DIW17_01490 [Clostridiales bacterium]|nr:hypothetical protein [Oscillospiraceae bacterium]HCS72536.1 hypothetical protein [Clostridiales bacterium]
MSSIKESWDKVNPDEATENRMLHQLLDRVFDSQQNKRNVINIKRIAKIMIPIAVCLLILLAGPIIYKNLDRSFDDLIVDPAPLSGDIKGLPVDHFKLSEIQTDNETFRFIYKSLGDILEIGMADCFLMIKVVNTETLKPQYHFQKGIQLSDVKVLENIYGECDEDTIQIKQSIYISNMEPDLTSQALLREGGVYLLPLYQHFDDDLYDDGLKEGFYYIEAVFDVLFEIDDNGLLYSHSDFPDFNRFDGQNYPALTDEIKRIKQGNDVADGESVELNVMKAWTGDFSEEKLKQTIDKYKSDYAPFRVSNREDAQNVTFYVKDDLDNFAVSRISSVGENYEELESYIDLAIDASYDMDAHTITIDVSWWYDASDWAQNYKTWSFLIRTVLEEQQTYFYYRIDFSGIEE